MDRLSIILKKAEKERAALNHPYVGTEHLLLAILAEDNTLTEHLKIYNLTYNKFKRKLITIIGKGLKDNNYNLYTPMLRNVLSDAEKVSLENGQAIDDSLLLKAIINEGEGIAIRIMQAMKIDPNKISVDDSSNLIKVPDEIITHREQEIALICQILMRKNKCNPLLLGEPGVGKTAIVEELARRLEKGNIPAYLKGYKIINVNLSNMLGGTKYRGDFEEKFNNLLHQAMNEKVILFIDEIHTLVNAGGADGAISAGDIIKPYLARGDIKCIGATTIREYHQYMINDQALMRRFQLMMIQEPSKEVTLDILTKIKSYYEDFHHLKINDNVLEAINNFAYQYLTNKRNPDKVIELLDSCCTYVKYNEKGLVTINDLYKLISNTYGLDFNNNFIKKAIDNRTIIVTQNINNFIKNMNINNLAYVNINGLDYQNSDDLMQLMGNPNTLQINDNYLLKSGLDNAIGILTIINYNCNKILKELVDKIIINRHIIDNHGMDINFNNYLIIVDKSTSDSDIGFTNNLTLKNVNYQIIDSLDKGLITN
jgi:ATP-dependent Clp protease ATP-binding subunit ClpC